MNCVLKKNKKTKKNNFLQSADLSPIPRDRMLVPNKCLENDGVVD